MEVTIRGNLDDAERETLAVLAARRDDIQDGQLDRRAVVPRDRVQVSDILRRRRTVESAGPYLEGQVPSEGPSAAAWASVRELRGRPSMLGTVIEPGLNSRLQRGGLRRASCDD